MYPFKDLSWLVSKYQWSTNPILKAAADEIGTQIREYSEDEKIVDGDIENNSNQQQDRNDNPELEDKVMNTVMPELQQPSICDKSPFGKVETIDNLTANPVKVASLYTLLKKGSAYIADVLISDLPKDTQKDIERFVSSDKGTKVIHYGMVVKELLSKVDKHNFESAMRHIEHDFDGKDIAKLKDIFYKKLPNKYILLMNDSITDGNHYLAAGKYLGITSSLNVLDLTPTRFQKSANLLDVLYSRLYGKKVYQM